MAVVDFRSIHRLFAALFFCGTGGAICRFPLRPAACTSGKDTKMSKKQASKAEKRIEKKAKYDPNRSSYLDKRTGDYVYMGQKDDGNGGQIYGEIARIPAGKYREWIRLLDEDDAAADLQERYELENRDYTTENRKQANQSMERNDSVADDGQTGNPIEEIPDRNTEPEKILFPETGKEDPRIQQIEQTKVTRLTEEQRNLYYDHVGQQMYLEEIRREKISVTGKNITQQAVSKQWRKTMKIFCDDLGVPVPETRGRHKKS